MMNSVKSESNALHTFLAAGLVAIAGFALQKGAFPEANLALMVSLALAAWITYSAAVARLTAKDFNTAFQKALFLDSLTYLPMALPLIAKVAVAVTGLNFGPYEQFANIPVIMAIGAALAANAAGKIILFPKNIEGLFEDARLKKQIKTAVAAAVILYFLFFSAVTIMRHSSFNSTAFDLAIFDQTIWAYSEGLGPSFFNTVRGLPLLADHMHPILFLLAPPYKLFPMPEGILVLQSLALALGALPVFWLARKRLGSFAASMTAFSYLLYPSLQYINLFDFHPEAFATPLILFALYFVDERKYIAATAALVLAGLSKEQFPLALVSVGTYVFLLHKKRLIGAAMAAAGMLWFIANFKILLPYFFGEAAYSHFRGYEYLGGTVTEAVKNAILHPNLAVTRLLAPDAITYLGLLFLPLGFSAIILLGLPYLLMAAPFLAINLLRSQDLTTAAFYQHNAELIPFIYLAAIMGAQQLARLLGRLKLNNTKAAIGIFVLLTTLAASAAYGPFATVYDLENFAQNEHTAAGRRMLQEIPSDAAVSADPLLLPHLTHRKEAYMFPNPFITFMHGKEFWTTQNGTPEGQSKVDYVLLDLSRASPTYGAGLYSGFVASLLNNRNYGLAKLEDGYALFRKSGDYGRGLCELNIYFRTSTSAAAKISLKDALNDENRIYLKHCQELQQE